MRALATIVMALMCVLGLATSSSGSTPVSTSSSSTHDIPTYDRSENYAAPAHGPPATANSHTATTHDAVERWSPRASAHQRDTVASRTYPYNHHVSHAQVAPALGATREHAQADGGGLSTTASVGVAAKTADDLLPGLPASAPKPLGLGSTGRVEPANLGEQLAMTSVRAEPGGSVLRRVEMSDPRWLASDGWVKMQQIENGVNIHYVRNTLTGAVDDFKFK